MKKYLSIPLTLLILLTGIHFTVSSHYCGGHLASTKISVSGKLASCGMEENKNNCSEAGDHIRSHCCDNDIAVYSINNDYEASFTNQSEIENIALLHFDIPVNETFNAIPPRNCFLSSNSPPDRTSISTVNLADICVFRN